MRCRQLSRYSPLLGIVLSLTLCGCATFSTPLQDLFVSDDAPPPHAEGQATQDVPSYMVELQSGAKDPEKYRLPLVDNDTYIQDVLDKSKAVKRFGRVTIQLWRPLPGEAGYHKLEVPYDRGARRIPPGYDYAVHPGDRLVFTEDETTVIDDMISNTAAPLRRFKRY